MGLIKNIKILFTVKKIFDMVKEGKMTEGMKTSEFWGKIVVQVMTVITALSGMIGDEWAVLIVSVLEGLYIIGRSIVKKTKGVDIGPLPAK